MAIIHCWGGNLKLKLSTLPLVSTVYIPTSGWEDGQSWPPRQGVTIFPLMACHLHLILLLTLGVCLVPVNMSLKLGSSQENVHMILRKIVDPITNSSVSQLFKETMKKLFRKGVPDQVSKTKNILEPIKVKGKEVKRQHNQESNEIHHGFGSSKENFLFKLFYRQIRK